MNAFYPLIAGLLSGLLIWAYMRSAHWLFPELLIEDEPKIRFQILGRAKKALKLIIPGVIGSSLFVGLATLLILTAFPGYYSGPWYACCAPMILAIGIMLPDFLFRKSIRAQIRRELVAMGRSICLSCGYDLRGNVSGRCPECGEE